MRMPEEVSQCVVFVGLPIAGPDGQEGIRFRGTAFIVSLHSQGVKGMVHTYLVTAKNIAAKLEGHRFLVRMNTKDSHSAFVQAEEVRWWYHPTDTSVNVAVIPWVPPLEVKHKYIPSSMFLSDDTIRAESIGIGDEVFMTGLFAHPTGSVRSLPIVRMGNIAMMPGEPVATREFGDIEAYLIEVRSIGGQSGSPVFVRKTVPMDLSGIYLLGLVHGHWDIPPQRIDDTIQPSDDVFASINKG